jgi:iron complex transport system permease protein
VAPLAVGIVVLLPFLGALAPGLRTLELGDDAATALGVRVERTRAGMIVVGVLLTALATAAAGPIPFVALAAPQIARRLTRASGPGLVAAGAMGAVLVLASDLVGQRFGPGFAVPVGVVTGVLGGAYLVWLLATEWRHDRG